MTPPPLTRPDEPKNLHVGERIEVQLNDGTWVRRVVATAPALQRVEGGTIHAIFVAGYPLPVPLGRCRRLAGRRA